MREKSRENVTPRDIAPWEEELEERGAIKASSGGRPA